MTRNISKFLLAAAVLTRFAYAQGDTEVHSLKVQGNITMLVGAGGNITVQIGRDGVLLVDAGLANATDKVLAELKKLTNLPIRYIIDTHFHPDHVGGNEKLRNAGGTIAGGNVSGDLGADAARGAQIIAHENILNRMSAPTGKTAATPTGAWPTDTFFGDEKKLYFDGEGVEIIHIPNAHTDGDSIVYFRRSDVISTGDLFTTTMYPLIDIEHGGTIQGFLAGLQKIIDLTIPVYGQDGGTLIIPGHGRLCDVGDLLNYREMTTIIRDRIQDLIKKGQTLEQVKAAKPTFDYDPLYGSNTFWNGTNFVEAVYKSLTQKK